MFDVFLSHSHDDAEWVEGLARALEDQHDVKPWLDKWMLIPGQPWQPAMARALAEASNCVVCLGATTPHGWFHNEIQKALNRQATDPDFGVIPLLLPTADVGEADQLKRTFKETFLEINTWVDFRTGVDDRYAWYLLVCAIRGEAPGRWDGGNGEATEESVEMTRKLRRLRELRDGNLVDDLVALDMQAKILEKFL